MTDKETKNTVKYWETTSKRDYDTMLGLFKIKRYPESLFFAHIILEKSLKALVVKQTKEQAPYIHDLTKLAELAKIVFDEETLDILDTINDFNIRARYPEHKLKLYKLCTSRYTEDKLNEVKKIFKFLWHQHQK